MTRQTEQLVTLDVIPAKAGIQNTHAGLDSRLRGNDNAWGKSFASLLLAVTLTAGHAPFTFGAPSPEVFLTLTRTELSTRRLPTTTSVVTAQDIQRSRAQNVADAIETTTGITIRRNGSLGALHLASLRGFSAKQVLVVVDDKPLPVDLTGTVDLSQLPVDNIERIEIVRGPGSVVYGANAEGGVIHIITRRPASDRLAAEATSEFRSFGTQIYRAHAGLKRGPAESQVSVSRNLSDGFQENSAFRNTSLGGYWGYDFGPGGALSFRASGSKGRVGLPSGTPVRDIGQFDGNRERRANRLTDNQADINRSYRLEHKLPVGDRATLIARLGNGVTDREAFQFGSTTQLRTEGRTGFLQANLPAGASLGYEYTQQRLNSNLYGDHTTNAWATFAQWTWSPTQAFTAIPAVRYDRHTEYGGFTSPRLTLVLQATPAWKFSSNIGRAFQAPTFADLFDPFVPSADRSPDLRPERSWQYDLGAHVASAEGFETGATLFRSDVTDRIALDPTRSFAAFNVDQAFNQGVEVEVGHAWQGTRHRVNYTYLQSEGKTAGFAFRPLQFSPRHVANYRVDFDGPWATGITSSLRYVHNQFSDIGEQGLKLPTFVVWGIRLSKRVGFWEGFFGVDNLTNRRYALQGDRFNGFYPQPGRTYWGGVTLRFYQ